MEQKQLDEIEESFYSEEFIDDDDTVKLEESELSKVGKSKSTTKKTEDNMEEKKQEEPKKEEEVKVEKVTKPVKVEKKVEEKPKEKIVKEDKPLVKETKPKEPTKEPTKSNEDNLFAKVATWKAIAAIVLIMLVVSVFTQGFNIHPTGATTVNHGVSLEDAEKKALDFINNNLLEPPYVAELQSSKESNGLYKLSILVSGQVVDSYVTKDGEIFFPQGINLNQEIIPPQDQLDPVIVEVSTENDEVKGDKNAPVTIVEFGDYECPFCGKYYEESYNKIIENYVNTGKVKYAFRDFPLSFHQYAQKASEAVECAKDQDKFWEMHDLLFENNDKLSVEDLKNHAKTLGLNSKAFDKCLDNDEKAEEINADFVDGQKYGVQGTPAIFINGKLISGAQPYEIFEQEINSALTVAGETEIEPKSELKEESKTKEPKIEEPKEEPKVEPKKEESKTETKESIGLTAKKWSFEPNTLTVKKGEEIELLITLDKSTPAFTLNEFTFAIPDLNVEKKVIGDTSIIFKAEKSGSFEFNCASCEDWRGMNGVIRVE